MKQSNDRYLKQLRARYNRATKKEKTVILDEYVKTTGRNRTYASALLSGRRRADQPICRPRRTIYGDEDRQVLLMLSDLFDGICSRRLRAAMDVELPGLVQSGALQVSPACYQDLLNRLYALLHDYTNSFLPVAKLHSKTRDGSRVTRTYDKPQTPYVQVLASPHVSEEHKAVLRETYAVLCVVDLRRQINQLQAEIIRLVSNP